MLLHAPSKSVLLQVDDPLGVRDLLPKSKLLDHPDYNIVVRHTVASTKILRNIGIVVPSPIQSQYGWPGKYKPFDHQRTAAEFKILNKRLFDLSEMGCVDASTEYLSPTGWVRMDQYAGGKVAQYDPTTETAAFVEPSQYVKLPCEQMIRIKTKYGLDQLLSPEHRVLLSAYRSPDRQEVISASALLARHNAWLEGENMGRCAAHIAYSKCSIPVTFSGVGGSGIPLTDAQLRLQVAVIADGHFSRRGNTRHCVMRLKKDRKKLRIRALLDAAGVTASERSNDTRTAQGFTAFSFEAPLRLKEFDMGFWAATPDQLRTIRDEVMHWDGSVSSDKPSERFSSYVKASADFVQYAFAATGRAARLTRIDRGAKGIEYMVQVRANGEGLLLCSRSSTGARHSVIAVEPSPDGFKYCFMVPSTFLIFRRNGCIFASGNTGKTASSLWSADYLMRAGIVRKCLILSPLSTLERVWKNDIFDVLMHRVAAVVHGTRERRVQALATDADFYIMNHDGLGIADICKIIRQRPDINLIIVDEAGMFRNHQTKKYKVLEKLLRPDMRLWLLTGTPCPNSPTDAWALARLVSPERVPKYFGSFKRITMSQISQFKWLPRTEAMGIAFNAMQPAIRFRKKDCIDLPSLTYLDRQATLSPEQRSMYQQMKSDMQTEAKTQQITAVNAADKIGKMRQILCGAIKDPLTGDYIDIPHGPRTEVLLECIEQADAKVIVIVPFKGIIRSLEKELSATYSVGVLNGDVSAKRRDQIIADFKHTPDPRILLCHPKVMAHGLNLTEADVLIFYAPISSNDEYLQVIERFNRTGQTRKMTVVKIAAHPLEWEVYKMVEGRKVTQEGILDLYKNMLE